MKSDEEARFNAALTKAKGIPPIIGGVVLDRLIGSGGMGIVFKGSHLRLQIPVAVKFIVDNGGDKNKIAHFVNEAALAARINSPFIVRVYDVNKDGPFNYIVMEHVSGQSASQRVCDAMLRGTPLSEDFVFNLTADVLRGLEAIHSAGFLHLDIKPDNLIITRQDGIAKILDFGLARPFEKTDVTGSVHRWSKKDEIGGTPGYASPEQLTFLTPGPPSDIYSLGVTVFAMLTGKPPFEVEKWEDAAVVQTKYELPDIRRIRSDLSDEAADWIKRCVRINPKNRFSSAMEALAALVEVNRRSATRRRNQRLPPHHDSIIRKENLPAGPPNPTGGTPDLAPLVYCVDDDANLLDLVSSILLEDNYRVECFLGGLLVLERLKTHVPDLVLIDIDMPGTNGLSVCATLRANPKLKHIPIVFLTGDTSAQTLQLALREGATDYLFKPVQSDELRARVKCLSRLSRAQRELIRLEAEYIEYRNRLSVLSGTKMP